MAARRSSLHLRQRHEQARLLPIALTFGKLQASFLCLRLSLERLRHGKQLTTNVLKQQPSLRCLDRKNFMVHALGVSPLSPACASTIDSASHGRRIPPLLYVVEMRREGLGRISTAIPGGVVQTWVRRRPPKRLSSRCIHLQSTCASSKVCLPRTRGAENCLRQALPRPPVEIHSGWIHAIADFCCTTPNWYGCSIASARATFACCIPWSSHDWMEKGVWN